MKVVIFKEEIEEAVKCYLGEQGLNTGEYDIDIKMVVGRTDDARVEIDLTKQKNDAEDQAEEPVESFQEKDKLPFGIRSLES
jgi:hypothetical protein